MRALIPTDQDAPDAGRDVLCDAVVRDIVAGGSVWGARFVRRARALELQLQASLPRIELSEAVSEGGKNCLEKSETSFVHPGKSAAAGRVFVRVKAQACSRCE